MGLFGKNSSNVKDSDLIDEQELCNLIKNDKIPAIKDHNGFAIFAREYENRRIILSNYIVKTLVRNDEFEDVVKYFKDKNSIDYISLFEERFHGATMVNMNLKAEDTYLVPIHFQGDGDTELSDNNIHYSENAKIISKDLSITATNINEMIFCPVKEPKTNKEYLPLFKSEKELRTIFPIEQFRIGKITYKEAVDEAKNFLGLVFRPTEENFIILNNIAGLFSSVSYYSRLCTDYKKCTASEKTIQDKIKRLHTIKPGKPEFNQYFRGILQSICDLDKIYVALSRKSINLKTRTGTPIITNKNGTPSLYVFSDISIAEKWSMRYENYLQGGIPLLGEVKRENDFDSLFAIASRIGPGLCTFDDGNSFLVFNIKLFMEINNLDSTIKLRVPKADADKAILNKNKKLLNINYNRIHILGMDKFDNTEYTELEFK